MSDDIDVKIGAQNAGLLSGLKQAEQAITQSTGYIRTSLTGLTDVVERVKLPFIELAAIMAGGAAFRSLVEGTEQLGIELEKAAQKTGITVEDLSGLKFAAEQVDVSFDSLIHGTQKLALALQQANEGATTPGAQALKAMGVAATDAAGHTRPMGDIVADIADKFKSYKDGADKTALAMNLFGRAGAEMIPFLNQGREGMEAGKNEALEMGAVMGGPAVEAAEKFHEAQGRVGLVAQGLKITLGTALMPALTLAANAFADSAKEGGALHEVILVLRDAIELLAIAFTGIVTSIRLIFAVGKFVFDAIGEAVVGTGKAIWDALHGNFSAARADMKVTGALMDQDFDTMVNGMVKAATDGAKAINATLGKAVEPAVTGAKKKEAPQIPKDHKKEIQEEWEMEKAGFDLQLALADENQIKIVAIKQEELERVRQLFGEHSKEYLEMAADLARAENEEQKKGAAIATKIANKAAADQKKLTEELTRQWDALFDGIARAVETSVSGIIQGTTSAGAAIKNILKSVLAEYIAVGVKSFLHHRAMELAKTGATAQGTAQRLALETWAAIKSVAIGAWSAIARIAQYAVEGAAAAFKSIAAIPIVGPFLAPAAAVAAGLAIGSFAGRIASAEGGYDIPSGLNPVTQLHQNEMVLPAALANKVRNMTDGAGSGGAVHFNITAIDRKGVRQFFDEHGDHIVRVLQGKERNFQFGQ